VIEQKPSSIGEAPSLDAIASSADEDRVGQVDFSSQLGAEERPSEETSSTTVALTRSADEAEAEPDADAEVPEQRSSPLILPPAKVDEAMAAEAARIRREVAAARGETVVDETEDLHDDESDAAAGEIDASAGQVDQDVDQAVDQDGAEAANETTPVAEDVEAPSATAAAEAEIRDAVDSVEQAESAPAARPRFRRTKPEPVAPPAPEPAAPPVSERLQIQDVASLDEIAEEVAAAEAAAEEAAARAEARADQLRRQSEAAAAAELEAASAASLAAGPVEDIDDLLADDPDDLVPPHHLSDHPADTDTIEAYDTDDELAVDQSVADVAASVIASMQAIGEANERHLEAVELEAARRCELLTAQAELDAELIRLHARREAHAIISAARMRAGEDLTPVETDQLSEIGETFSRFAESIETTIAPGPASPDTTRKS